MGLITGSDKPTCSPLFYPVALPFLRVIYPPSLCTETVYLSKILYIRHIVFFSLFLRGYFLKGARFGGESLLSWDRSIRGFSERQKIIVTFEGPLVLELSAYIIGLHETYDFHHTLFCHPTLFMLFSCLSLPRRFFAAYI